MEKFDSTLRAFGLKVSASSILDLSNPDFFEVPEEIRAASWLAAKEHGWTENGVRAVIKQLMGKRYDQETGDLIIEELKECAAKYPNVLDKK